MSKISFQIFNNSFYRHSILERKSKVLSTVQKAYTKIINKNEINLF